MAVKRSGGLGRGLGALLHQAKTQLEQADGIEQLAVDDIRSGLWRPRRIFDEVSLNELAESIKTYGVLQPILVRSAADGYELISGDRRLRAAIIAGLETIPAIVRQYSDAQLNEIFIVENVQREPLNIIEEAQAYARLIDEFGYSQELLATKIGCSPLRLEVLLSLLQLSSPVQSLIAEGELSIDRALPLLSIVDPNLQLQIAELIVAEGLSPDKVEALIEELETSGLLEMLTDEETPLEFDIENFSEAPLVEVVDASAKI